MIKQNLSQKMLLKLSPQQIQLMKLFQIPTASLEQRIQQELEENPALEEGEMYDDMYSHSTETSTDSDLVKEDFGKDSETSETYELDDYVNEYMEDDPNIYNYGSEQNSEDGDRTIPVSMDFSFHEHLENQLSLLNLSEDQIIVAKQIIGSIDDDGYLRRDPDAITDDLLFSQNLITSTEEIYRILRQIQKFDPPGVGARNLQECLALQLEYKLSFENNISKNDPLKIAYRIINEMFDEFSKKHFEKLKKQLLMDEKDLRAAMEVILKLNPKPASGYSRSKGEFQQYIVPDFIIENKNGELELSLNSKNAPDLKVSNQYKEMLRSYKRNADNGKITKKDKETILFIRQKIDSAKWFIDALQQRYETLMATMYAIMQFQYEYFLTGDPKNQKPMILKDISDVTGLDISTISRVANSKFVQTEFGTMLLKNFFSESIQNEEGEEVSTKEIKNLLTNIVKEENKQKPLSDDVLKEILKNKGFNIARRTITKYREQLNIPVARLRKEL